VNYVRGEISIEPWQEGEPGPHVQAAYEAGGAGDPTAELEPLSITIEGPVEEVASNLVAAMVASVDNGATRISLSLTVQPPMEHPVVKTARELAEAVGGRLIPVAELTPTDIVVEHEGEVLAGLRKPRLDLDGALQRLVDDVETHFGAALRDLSRADKQAALVMLEERGAFTLRNAAEELAELLGVSRVTLYNYLNAIRKAPPAESD